MNRTSVAAAFLLPLFAAPAGLAATPVPVGHFDAVGLSGGGHVVIRHGANQQVTLLKGDLKKTRIEVRNGRSLEIEACVRDCAGRYDLEIEIVTPDLDAIAIEGGGHIEAQSGFPARARFAAAVNGGGHIDARGIAAADVNAAVSGGGNIQVLATKSLEAAVDGGGSIDYSGTPHVTSAINGGGHVGKAAD